MSLIDLVTDGANPDELPNWVSKNNATHDAYKAINSLKTLKLEYISSHNKTIDYRSKKYYQVLRSEVGSETGVTRQVLFNTSKYSEALCDYLSEVNCHLDQKKQNRLSKASKSLQAKPKSELLKLRKIGEQQYNELVKKTASDQLQTSLEKMSFATKRKLGLD